MWAILSSTKTNCLWYSVSLSYPHRYCKHTIPLAQYRTKSSVGTQTTDPIDTVGIWISLYIHWGFTVVLMFLVMYFVRVLKQLFSTQNDLVLNMVVHTAGLVGLFSESWDNSFMQRYCYVCTLRLQCCIESNIRTQLDSAVIVGLCLMYCEFELKNNMVD